MYNNKSCKSQRRSTVSIYIYNVCVHESVCSKEGGRGGGGGVSPGPDLIMSSCSYSLLLGLHPFPLWCALAEVSAEDFNPVSQIFITFHLLHSTYCPGAAVVLLKYLHHRLIGWRPWHTWHTGNTGPKSQPLQWRQRASVVNFLHPLKTTWSEWPVWATIGQNTR